MKKEYQGLQVCTAGSEVILNLLSRVLIQEVGGKPTSLRFLQHLARQRSSVSKLKYIISIGDCGMFMWIQAAYYFLLKPKIFVQQ